MTNALLYGLGAAIIAAALVRGFVKFNDWLAAEIDRIATDEDREERGHYSEGPLP